MHCMALRGHDDDYDDHDDDGYDDEEDRDSLLMQF